MPRKYEEEDDYPEDEDDEVEETTSSKKQKPPVKRKLHRDKFPKYKGDDEEEVEEPPAQIQEIPINLELINNKLNYIIQRLQKRG